MMQKRRGRSPDRPDVNHAMLQIGGPKRASAPAAFSAMYGLSPFGAAASCLSRGLKEGLEILQKLIGIDAVGAAGLLDIFAARHGAAHAVHADGLEGGHRLGRVFNDLRNQGFTGDFHLITSIVICEQKGGHRSVPPFA